MGIHMVEVGDIIEITDASFTKKGVSLLGRRYEVKKKIGRAKIPELRATALPEGNEDYNPQGDGSTWESAGLSHKGRPNAIPKGSYTVVGAAEQTGGGGFGGAALGQSQEEESEDEELEDEDFVSPYAGIKYSPIGEDTTIEDRIEEAAFPFQTIGHRTNSLLEPFVNDRELDYKKMLPQVQFTEADGAGLRARVIFSAPINYIEPNSYETEATFGKKVISSGASQRKQIIREYEIGKEVKDILGSKAQDKSKFQCYRNGQLWDVPTKCIGRTIVVDLESDEYKCPPTLIAHLEAMDDSQDSWFLVHPFQAGVQYLAPDTPDEVEAAPLNPFGGGKTGFGLEGGFGGDAVAVQVVDWTKIIKIPCFDQNEENNKFPSTQKGADTSLYDIRAVLGITFDHDDPVFKDYEKPYTVNWDICPAIVAGDESNGFVEAQFEVHQPPEGRPTDRLPGASRAWVRLKEENPEGVDPKGWKYYPRLVRVILPAGDSQDMDIPIEGKSLDEAIADAENALLAKVDEVRYYTHPPTGSKGKIRELRLTQTKMKRSLEGKEEVALHAIWKVGDDYEFRTKAMDESNQWQKFRGRLLKIVVNENASRENAYKSAVEARRNQRLFATKSTDQADLFFTKDPQHPNSFVIAVKNRDGEAFTGQIIRINLGE